MSRSQKLCVMASVVVLSLSGCMLRPRYSELVGIDASKQPTAEVVELRILEEDSGRPIPGAVVHAGERAASRVAVMTDEEGRVKMPVTRELLAENPLVVVALPKGFGSYRVEVVEPATRAPAAAAEEGVSDGAATVAEESEEVPPPPNEPEMGGPNLPQEAPTDTGVTAEPVELEHYGPPGIPDAGT